MSPVRVEQTLFLRLNKHLIPGLNMVLVSLLGFKEKHKASGDAAVAAKNSVSGVNKQSSYFTSLE